MTTRRRQRSLLLAAFAVFFGVVIAHAPSLYFAKFLNVDEAYAGAIAERLLAGEELYQGAISQRGPLFYYFYEAIALVADWDNIRAIRLVSLTLSLLTIGLTYRLHRAVRASRTTSLVSASTLAFLFVLGLSPIDGLALNAELVLAPLFILGVSFGVGALEAPPDRELTRLAASALCFGVATCIKQLVLIHGALVVGLACLMPGRTSARLVRVAVAVASMSFAPALFALRAWHKGSLADLIYYTWTYNKTVHLAFTKERDPGRFLLPILEQPAMAIAVVLVIVAWLGRRKQNANVRGIFGLTIGVGVDWVAINFACALAVSLRAPQGFGHYFVHVFPLFAVLFGEMVGRVVPKHSVRTGLVVTNVAFAVLTTIQATRTLRNEGRQAHDAEVERAATALARATNPGDTVFVWGFSSWLYGYSGRPIATRFPFVTYPTGFVPWFWSELDLEAARAVPGSMDALISDIERARPRFLVDAGSIQIARPMRAYRAMHDLVTRDYCFAFRVGHFDFYERHDPGASCALPCFPLSPPLIDYLGKPMAVRAPSVHDADTSPVLSTDSKVPIPLTSCSRGTLPLP